MPNLLLDLPGKFDFTASTNDAVDSLLIQIQKPDLTWIRFLWPRGPETTRLDRNHFIFIFTPDQVGDWIFAVTCYVNTNKVAFLRDSFTVLPSSV